MRVTITGATGRIGRRLVDALRERGDDVTVLSRQPEGARAALGVEAVGWQPEQEPAPAAALAGRAGEGRVVCVVSGGNIDASTLAPILLGETP